MSSYIIEKSKFFSYLNRLAEKFEVHVPVSTEGISLFAPYQESLELDFASHPRLSAKSFFLPQREVMLQHDDSSAAYALEQGTSDSNRLLFGVKPCDARAIEINARLLANDSGQAAAEDIFFKKRVDTTVLVGYGCDQPGAGCFCSSTGGGPFDQTGLDALITDIGDRLVITLFEDRPKSQKLIDKDLTEVADSEAHAAAAGIAEDTEKKLSAMEGLVKPEARDSELFELALWEETAERCVNCGICTYLCPTCTCFDMIDEASGGCTTQSRCWDSCMFGLFTLHASGHNPRPGRKERVRQRFMHKLSYFPDRYDGTVGCVGCGRCVIYCPVNIDIREISRLMAEVGG
jgi:ferredoxin